jgi:hypothetical protein
MIVKKEKSKNDEDVYSFWEKIENLDDDGNIIKQEIKVDETTIEILRENASMIEKDIIDLENILSKIYQKISMVEFGEIIDMLDEK